MRIKRASKVAILFVVSVGIVYMSQQYSHARELSTPGTFPQLRVRIKTNGPDLYPTFLFNPNRGGFAATIYNIGNKTAEPSVARFSCRNTAVSSIRCAFFDYRRPYTKQIPRLKPGENYQFTIKPGVPIYSWSSFSRWFSCDPYRFSLVADYGRRIRETKEGNNTSSSRWRLGCN